MCPLSDSPSKGPFSPDLSDDSVFSSVKKFANAVKKGVQKNVSRCMLQGHKTKSRLLTGLNQKCFLCRRLLRLMDGDTF